MILSSLLPIPPPSIWTYTVPSAVGALLRWVMCYECMCYECLLVLSEPLCFSIHFELIYSCGAGRDLKISSFAHRINNYLHTYIIQPLANQTSCLPCNHLMDAASYNSCSSECKGEEDGNTCKDDMRWLGGNDQSLRRTIAFRCSQIPNSPGYYECAKRDDIPVRSMALLPYNRVVDQCIMIIRMDNSMMSLQSARYLNGQSSDIACGMKESASLNCQL